MSDPTLQSKKQRHKEKKCRKASISYIHPSEQTKIVHAHNKKARNNKERENLD